MAFSIRTPWTYCHWSFGSGEASRRRSFSPCFVATPGAGVLGGSARMRTAPEY